jgi:hypothetical protein
VKTFNIKDETCHSIAVARDDGAIEIYSYEHGSPFPLLRHEQRVPESVTGIEYGYISNN